MDFLLSTDGDLDTSANDLTLTSGLTEIGQDIDVRLKSYRGEWFPDADSGIPWHQEILGQKPNIPKITAYIRTAILGVPGVVRIEEARTQYQSSNRQLDIIWSVVTAQGTVEGVTAL